MNLNSMADVRESLDRMAAYNKVSITGLNIMAGVAKGILARLRRAEVPSRNRPGDPTVIIEPDIKLSTYITVVKAAGWQLTLEPVPLPNRRTRKLAEIAANGGGEDGAPATGADLGG